MRSAALSSALAAVLREAVEVNAADGNVLVTALVDDNHLATDAANRYVVEPDIVRSPYVQTVTSPNILLIYARELDILDDYVLDTHHTDAAAHNDALVTLANDCLVGSDPEGADTSLVELQALHLGSVGLLAVAPVAAEAKGNLAFVLQLAPRLAAVNDASPQRGGVVESLVEDDDPGLRVLQQVAELVDVLGPDRLRIAASSDVRGKTHGLSMDQGAELGGLGPGGLRLYRSIRVGNRRALAVIVVVECTGDIDTLATSGWAIMTNTSTSLVRIKHAFGGDSEVLVCECCLLVPISPWVTGIRGSDRSEAGGRDPGNSQNADGVHFVKSDYDEPPSSEK